MHEIKTRRLERKECTSYNLCSLLNRIGPLPEIVSSNFSSNSAPDGGAINPHVSCPRVVLLNVLWIYFVHAVYAVKTR